MISIAGRGRSVGRGAAALALAGLATACASGWGLHSVRPEIALQWPFQPNPAKLTYLESLTGFSPRKGGGSVWRSVVYGNERKRPNEFVLPVAVAAAPDGRIAVADLGRRCVHLYVPAEQTYRRLEGTEAEPMVSPVGVAFDDQGRLYVSDSGGRLFAFGADGAFRFALRQVGKETLQRPTGLAFSPVRQLLYVVDTLGNRVHALRPTGEPAFSFGRRGEGPDEFNFPTHIFRSPAGELVITDSLNFRIGIFDEEGRPRGTFGHHGDGSGDLAMPKGVAVDRDGVIYVVDSLFDNVQLFSRQGEFLLTLGRRGVDFGEFWLPSGIFISDSGELYVCDTYNRRVQVYRITEHYAETRS